MRRVVLLLGKDLRVLRRSPLLLALLVLYPLVIALVVAVVVRYAGERPRIALVDEDGLPAVLVVGGERFDVQQLFDEAAADIELVPMSRAAADRELETGRALGVLVVPEGFAEQVRSMAESPKLVLRTTPGGLGTTAIERAKSLVYSLNRELQETYIETNLGYVRLLLEGGSGTILGDDFTLMGIDEAKRRLEALAGSSDPNVAAQAADLLDFLGQTETAVEGVDDFLRATANPIELSAERSGRGGVLSEEIQAYALAISLTLVGLLLGAGSLSAERDENVIGRLVRGLVSLAELVLEKIAFVAAVVVVVGLVLAVAFGIAVELGSDGGQAWSRLPLVLAGLVLSGASLGAAGALLGTLARDARTATLVAVLAALPIVLVGLVPAGVTPVAGWVSDAFPFVHAARFFSAAFADADPAGTVGREAGWLLGLTVVYATLVRVSVRRLLT